MGTRCDKNQPLSKIDLSDFLYLVHLVHLLRTLNRQTPIAFEISSDIDTCLGDSSSNQTLCVLLGLHATQAQRLKNWLKQWAEKSITSYRAGRKAPADKNGWDPFGGEG